MAKHRQPKKKEKRLQNRGGKKKSRGRTHGGAGYAREAVRSLISPKRKKLRRRTISTAEMGRGKERESSTMRAQSADKEKNDRGSP